MSVAKLLPVLSCHTYPLSQTPASTDPLRRRSLLPVVDDNPCVGESNIGDEGQLVSSIIVSFITSLIFSKLSLNLIYTVFVPSPLGNVRERLEEHDCRLVGDVLDPKATCIEFIPVSVAHVVVKTTLVPVV